MNSIQSEKSRNTGHRKRLRDKFIQSGFDGFLDYEVVELLLTLGTPRKDCKIQAKEIVKKFKEDSFRIIESEPERLAEIKGISERKAQEIYQQFHDMFYAVRHGSEEDMLIIISARGKNERLIELRQFHICHILSE